MGTRPNSIVTFERLYLGAFVLGVVNTILSWSSTRALAAASGQAEMLSSGFLPATTAIGFAITLALWYFIARKGSAVAKWIATVFVVLGVIGVVIGLLMPTAPLGSTAVIGLVSIVLQVIAITFLFKPDTKAWFGETRNDAA